MSNELEINTEDHGEAIELLAFLRARRLRVRWLPSKNRFTVGPSSRMTEELKSQIHAVRDRLAELLQFEHIHRAYEGWWYTCHHCGGDCRVWDNEKVLQCLWCSAKAWRRELKQVSPGRYEGYWKREDHRDE